ncbi:MFS transporter [Aestuariivirga litoralis]|uniref:MFS transporter n=1 Tax=Aestuariivirga litoralis TaxID=2650924 RepID=A0A2W2BG32_9HYPH|nr:MFS transporter [Aestuariivirga litoralis]PZF75169.1 MFS transporter [Aestuariivirga litoralis]
MRAFLTFLAAYVLSQFYRSFLAVIAPELARELALDPQALGNLQAFWILGFVVTQFPVGWALDTVGPRRTVALQMLAAVAGALLFATAHSATALNIAMLLIGAGCGSIYMGAIYLFGRIAAPQRFALLCSWLLGLGTAGNLLAASPLAWVAQSIGWRAAMAGMAAATALSALSVLLLIRDPERITSHGSRGLFGGVGDILKIRSLWPLLPITAVSYAVVLAERGLWAGPYFSSVFGLEPVARGNALLVMAAAMSAGAMAYGPLDRLLGTRKWVVFGGVSVTALCFAALALPGLSLSMAILIMGLLGGFGMTYGVLMAHGRSFVPDHLLGRGITLLNVLFIGGAGVLQPASGALMKRLADQPPEQAYATLHLIFAGLLAVSLVVYLFAQDNPPKK